MTGVVDNVVFIVVYVAVSDNVVGIFSDVDSDVVICVTEDSAEIAEVSGKVVDCSITVEAFCVVYCVVENVSVADCVPA